MVDRRALAEEVMGSNRCFRVLAVVGRNDARCNNNRLCMSAIMREVLGVSVAWLRDTQRMEAKVISDNVRGVCLT